MKIRKLLAYRINRKQLITYGIILAIIFTAICGITGIATAETNPCGKDNSYLGTFQKGQVITLKQTCESCTYVNISAVTYPDSRTTILNKAMTKNGINYNYTFTDTNIGGCYSYDTFGDKDGVKAETIDFQIASIGSIEDKGFTQQAFFVGIAMFISILIFLKVSKFFGSLMVMIIGLGMLFMIPQNGWIGWIVFACGFLMTFYSLITPRRRR